MQKREYNKRATRDSVPNIQDGRPRGRLFFMPFVKVGPNKYKSPSGKIWTKRQMIAYYASKGTFSKKKQSFNRKKNGKKHT